MPAAQSAKGEAPGEGQRTAGFRAQSREAVQPGNAEHFTRHIQRQFVQDNAIPNTFQLLIFQEIKK